MVFADTHAHIYLDQFREDYPRIILNAEEASVEKIIMPNIDSSTISQMLEMEGNYQSVCKAAMGIHPCSIKEDFEKELEIADQWLNQRPFIGIGETGTDLYWDKTYIEQQKIALEVHIGWAKKYQLPIILHSRDSLDITIEIIEKNHSAQLMGVFHCFSGDIDQARRIIDLGFYLGIGGVLTFKNANVSTIIKVIAPEHLVLETDSPYLAPVPHRGKRNEPSYVPLIAEKLASIYDMSVIEIAKITTENAKKIFKY